MTKKYKRMEVVPGEIESLKAEVQRLNLHIDALRKGEQKIAENVNSWVERYTELEKRYQTALDKLEETNRLNSELRIHLWAMCDEIGDPARFKEAQRLAVELLTKGSGWYRPGSIKTTETEKRNDEDPRRGCVDFGHRGPVESRDEFGKWVSKCRNCGERVG